MPLWRFLRLRYSLMSMCMLDKCFFLFVFAVHSSEKLPRIPERRRMSTEVDFHTDEFLSYLIFSCTSYIDFALHGAISRAKHSQNLQGLNFFLSLSSLITCCYCKVRLQGNSICFDEKKKPFAQEMELSLVLFIYFFPISRVWISRACRHSAL